MDTSEASFYSWLLWSISSLILAATIAWYFLRPKKKKEKLLDPSNYSELVAERLEAFNPSPLVESLTPTEKLVLDSIDVVASKPGRVITVKSKSKHGTEESMQLVNFGSTDFLGFSTDSSTKEIAIKALNKYGCGSCGPRGFYGTFDVHLQLEHDLKNFFGTEACIVYSDSYSTAPSVLAAFASRGDYLIIDEACNDSIMNGVHLARSNVLVYKHNDMEHLREVLTNLQTSLKNALAMKQTGNGKGLKKPDEIRKIIVSEAIFRTDGSICDVKALVGLRREFKVRLFLDESLSVGVLGKTGRGLCEQEGIPLTEVDFFIGSLDNVFASIGGFCVGKDVVVEHQVLMGAGYCFSAAVAPFLSAIAITSLKKLSDDGSNESSPLSTLQKNIQDFHTLLLKSSVLNRCFTTASAKASPICHLSLKNNQGTKFEQYTKLHAICDYLKKEGLFVVCAVQTPAEMESHLLKPSLRLSFTANHTEDDIKLLINSLEKAVQERNF